MPPVLCETHQDARRRDWATQGAREASCGIPGAVEADREAWGDSPAEVVARMGLAVVGPSIGAPVVLGLDVGFTALGCVIVHLPSSTVRESHCWRTERSDRKRAVRVADDDARRCAELAGTLRDVFRGNRVVGVVAELPHAGAQGARANRSMGLATGVVVCAVEWSGLPVEWVTPDDVKRLTGSRQASKQQVQAAVRGALRWEPGTWPNTGALREHVADAAGAVLAAWDGTLLRLLRNKRDA